MPDVGGGFARLAGRLATLSREGAARVVRAVAQEAVAQSMACFRESRNPYGEPWAKLKHRSGKPLLDTGRGRASITVGNLSDRTFRIGTNVRYMHAHQDGVNTTYGRKASSRFQAVNRKGRFLSKKRAASSKAMSLGFRRLDMKGGEVHLVIPQRSFFPSRGRPQPGPIWDAAFTRVALAVMAKVAR